ncbi:MAG TPA: hypothetical protein VK862_06985 [Afifellaceae bacterium]|nr:hypothetical protein [Afifellaceae bacterium]
MGVNNLVIDFEAWVRGLLETGNHLPIGIALAITIVAIAIGYRSKFNVFVRRDYLTDPEELRRFDEQEALEKWKRDHEQDS